MAQLTSTSITIDGNPIRQFSSFSLSQGIFEHHFFRLTCPAESIDGSMGAAFSQSKNLMGAVLAARIDSVTTQGQLEFRGIVTQVETERFSGASGDVVISGYSPTIMLESGPHCKSWEKKAVKNIVQDVLKHFPQNLLKPKIAPTYPETLAYYVQYKETAWRFLCRVCSTFGEWLYFDGKGLVVGPTSDTSVNLLYGNNLSRFTMSLQVRPPGMQVMGYDYINNEVYSSTPSGVESRAGLNDLGKHAFKASQAVYATQPKVWNNNFLTNKRQLDELVNIQSAMRSTNHVRFNGSSGHPGVTVGGKISVNGQNIYSLSDESFGDYTIISVNHYADGQGNYNNDFVAVPASIKLPPVATLPEPVCETQSAIVTDNHDTKGLGRIRVRFHWMKPDEKTPWLRISSPHGGGEKGMFFIPEIGEEVIIGFEGNSATKGYVDGTVYHGKAFTAFSNSGNDVKALQTRSGNRVILNDAEGSITIVDPSNNTVVMDGNGNITISSKESITLNSKFINFNASQNIAMTAKENITGEARNISSAAGEAFDVKAKTVSANGSESMSLTTKKLSANGSVSTTVSGGKVEVSAPGDITVSGAIVKINS